MVEGWLFLLRGGVDHDELVATWHRAPVPEPAGLLDPDRGLGDNARRLLAAAYGQAGQLDRAVEVYREAIENAAFDEQRIQLHAALAELYASQSRKAEAVGEYEAIVELQPEGPAADEARRQIAELTVQPLTGGNVQASGEEVADGSSPADSATP